jgi:uncharacterized protein YndB with AHSA1/START domain
MNELAALDLVFEEVYDHPIEKVWSALTNADDLAAWLMPSDFEPRVGKTFTLHGTPMPGWRGWANCEVLEMQPPHRMVWSWVAADDGLKTLVKFELETLGLSTRLTLRHEGEINATIAELLAGGWPGRLAALAQLVDLTEN